jgi:hypothetical protein
MRKLNYFLLFIILASSKTFSQNATEIYVNPTNGCDCTDGNKGSPLKTLAAAVEKANADRSTGPVTIILSPGIYSLDQTLTLKPVNRELTGTNRLTIRAQILPDDPDWNTSSMPTIIPAMPLSEMWNGRKDPFGGVADGFLVETSHVTFQGLKLMGIPVVEHPKTGFIQRVYPIARYNSSLDDLEISQCLFAGDEAILPLHLGILANGTSIVVDHCIFYNLKQAIVYWSLKSTGHIMRYSIMYGGYGCGIWTSAIANDFVFENNVIANGNYVWISQQNRDAGQQGNVANVTTPILYNVKNSLFAGNKKFVGTGGGPALNFKDVDPSVFNLVNTKITDKPVQLEMDQSKRTFLHPVEGTEAAAIGAGLFKR